MSSLVNQPGQQSSLEVMVGRRAFAVAQAAFAAGPSAGVSSRALSLGWHDATVNGESGSFALVAQNAGLDDLVGEIVSIAYGPAMVYAYVLGSAALGSGMSVTRRLYLALARLTMTPLEVSVVAVG